ncbi:hypothetical protein MP228_001102 [Amoeboaphelidium protococcarum]|nr:hypothetical protein MP228_001102 [Amoeboaphelidium protococcarum]
MLLDFPLSLPTKLSTMSSVFNRLRSAFSGRTFVGKDLSGNKFYETIEAQGKSPRRMVVIKGHYGDSSSMSPQTYISDNIAPQWKAWLAHTRSDAPTLEELAADIQRQEVLKQRVEQLEVQYEQEKLLEYESKRKQLHLMEDRSPKDQNNRRNN